LIISRSGGLNAPPPDLALLQGNCLRKPMNAANAVVHSKAPDLAEYSAQLHERRTRRAHRIKEELRRVIGFVALTDAYALEVPTVERMMDTLGRLEVEVLGRLRFYPPRSVRVVTGEPINLAARWADWQTRGEDAADVVTEELESAVRSLLVSTAGLMTVLAE
jgi:hypothetical protein